MYFYSLQTWCMQSYPDGATRYALDPAWVCGFNAQLTDHLPIKRLRLQFPAVTVPLSSNNSGKFFTDMCLRHSLYRHVTAS